MPTWLAEPPFAAYALLVALALVALAAIIFFRPAASGKKEKDDKKVSPRLVLAGIAALAVLLLVGLKAADSLYESDREQIVRKLNEMSAGVAERNLDKVFQHVSDSFRYGSSNKQTLRSVADRALQSGQVTEIPMWLENAEPIVPENGKASVLFRFKVRGNALGENQFLCRAKWVQDSDGQWRLQGFAIYPPTGTRDEFAVPGL